MRHITVADGYGAPQPQHRAVWIIGGQINGMIVDELRWFSCHKPGRTTIHPPNSKYLVIGEMWNENYPPSLRYFLTHLEKKDSVGQNIEFLYSMLNDEEFEHLVAYLLEAHPAADDITNEDYVLSLFVEHEKQRRMSYV